MGTASVKPVNHCKNSEETCESLEIPSPLFINAGLGVISYSLLYKKAE
jgi:hypothetical protein